MQTPAPIDRGTDALLVIDVQNDFCPAARWRCRRAMRWCLWPTR